MEYNHNERNVCTFYYKLPDFYLLVDPFGESVDTVAVLDVACAWFCKSREVDAMLVLLHKTKFIKSHVSKSMNITEMKV